MESNDKGQPIVDEIGESNFTENTIADNGTRDIGFSGALNECLESTF